MGSVFGSIFDRFGARVRLGLDHLGTTSSISGILQPLIITGGIGFSLACMMQSIWLVSLEFSFIHI